MEMVNGKIALASGGTIQMHSLRQWLVYSGILEGLPTREMNNRMIDALRRKARDRTGHEPFLIDPTQESIEYDGKYPFGEPALLPPVGCEADFVQSGGGYEMRLTVIWFQHDYAFPLDPEVERALVGLDWKRLAQEPAI